MKVIEELNRSNRPIDFILAAGDDMSDEKMFVSLNELNQDNLSLFTVIVGKKVTEADYYVDNVEQFV